MRLFRTFIPALLLLAMLAAPSPSKAAVDVGVSVEIAPPALPVYVQPPIPAPGYIWTPGYWAWGPYGYYWIPGTWVYPPVVGVLWTPPWWGWVGGVYVFHAGYWGPHIGFYGGINYGFGYFGSGYEGGYWDHGRFFYNREVNNITNVHITNVYNKTVVNNTRENRVSFNGGNGGTNAHPTPQEQAATREHHFQPTGPQTQHVNAARSNRDLAASANNGQPKIAATNRAGHFNNAGVVATARPSGPKGGTQGGPHAAHGTFQGNGPQGGKGHNGPGGPPHVTSQAVHPQGHGGQGPGPGHGQGPGPGHGQPPGEKNQQHPG